MASLETKLPNRSGKGSLWKMTGQTHVVTFIGAGGKTTCVQAITQEIVSAGQRVIATTTTKVFPDASMKRWKSSSPPPYEQQDAFFWYVDVLEDSGKWVGPPLQAVDEAIANSNTNTCTCTSTSTKVCTCTSLRTAPDLHSDHNKLYWVIEGDGARGLKLKCWEPHEPQIPKRSDCVVLVLKGGLWGKILLEEQVHRPACCSELLGQVWDAETAWCYFLRSPVFDPQYELMSWVILLNCHEKNAENEDLVKSLVLLEDLRHRWEEIQPDIEDLKYRPSHLRLAAGDAKEGKLQWFDLW